MFWNRNLLPYNVYSVLIDLEFRDLLLSPFSSCLSIQFHVMLLCSFLIKFFRHEFREVFLKQILPECSAWLFFIQSKIALLDWYHCKLVLLIYWAFIWCLYNHFSSLPLLPPTSFSTPPIIVVKFINFCIDVMKSRLHKLWTVVRS